MWLFTRYGFYSIACGTNPDGLPDLRTMMIRARCVSHLERLQKRFSALADARIKRLPDHDYRYRLIVRKELWTAIVSQLVEEQIWSNFKNEVGRFQCAPGRDYVDALHRVWEVMRDLQESSGDVHMPWDPSDADRRQRPAIIWDGITKAETLGSETVKLRRNLADLGRDCKWDKLLTLLSDNPDLVNVTRPGGRSRYTPLHQAAYGGATVEVVGALLKLGAFRTAKNAAGERPVDLARKKSHKHLMHILEPVYARRVPSSVLSGIQNHFHALIHQRVDPEIRKNALRLPELEPLLEFPSQQFWFPVPGMYGGFAYWLVKGGAGAKLVTESWCRVVEGSGRRHEVTARGCTLVAEEFAEPFGG
jgi:hypothetical protein